MPLPPRHDFKSVYMHHRISRLENDARFLSSRKDHSFISSNLSEVCTSNQKYKELDDKESKMDVDI